MKRYVVVEDKTIPLSMWKSKGIEKGYIVAGYCNLDIFFKKEGIRKDLLYSSKIFIDVGLLKEKGIYFLVDHFPGLKYYLHSGGIFRVQDFPGAIGVVDKGSFTVKNVQKGIFGS